MRLHEIAMSGDTMYKGIDPNPEVVPDDAFELRTAELKYNISMWKKNIKNMPEGPGKLHDKYVVDNMEQELRDFKKIGEIPFTFYAAKDREHAEYFQAQFKDGVIDEVKLTAKNLATVEDLRALGFKGKQTVSHLTPIMIHTLKQAGFDGATGPIDNIQGGEEIVVFSPEQVQRA